MTKKKSGSNDKDGVCLMCGKKVSAIKKSGCGFVFNGRKLCDGNLERAMNVPNAKVSGGGAFPPSA